MSVQPTEEQLAAVLRHPNSYLSREGYEGGFTTKDQFGNDAVWFQVTGDEDGVHLHSQVSTGTGGGLASSYTRLSKAEALELALALELAAKAAS